MDIGDLIFYIVLVGVWVVPYLAKKLSASTPTPEKKGVALRILEFIAEFKSGAERQAEEQLEVLSGQMPLSPEMNAPPGQISKGIPLRRKQVKAEIKEIRKEEASFLRSPVIVHKPKKIRRKFPRQKMREAIIWSEILQPPVGLREKEIQP